MPGTAEVVTRHPPFLRGFCGYQSISDISFCFRSQLYTTFYITSSKFHKHFSLSFQGSVKTTFVYYCKSYVLP